MNTSPSETYPINHDNLNEFLIMGGEKITKEKTDANDAQ